LDYCFLQNLEHDIFLTFNELDEQINTTYICDNKNKHLYY